MLRYRGRTVTPEDIAAIRALIASQPDASRRVLSRKLCEAWDWRQTNGALQTMVCRGLMLALHRAGHIELPAVRKVMPNPLANRRRPPKVEVDTTPIRCRLSDLGPLVHRQVRRTPEEAVFNSLLEQYHYLGYMQPVGAHLKYLVMAGPRPVAAISFSSPPRHLGARDRYIGWLPAVRERNLHRVAYNPRFLIPPWVEVPHLASHVLGALARRISEDWRAVYGHGLEFLETFVDIAWYRGTCYRAANWIVLGETTGRGHNAWTKKKTKSIKQVLGYPLSRRFRERLCEVG